MRQRLQSGGRLWVLVLVALTSFCQTTKAQSVTLKLDKEYDADTLKVTLSIKQSGMISNPAVPPTGSGIMLGATIDLLYDPTQLLYGYSAHPVVSTVPVYESYPRTIGIVQALYGNTAAGSVDIVPSRVPNPDTLDLNGTDFCNPPTGACATPYVRVTMEDGSLSDAWQFLDDTYQSVITHKFYIIPGPSVPSDVAHKTTVLPDVALSDTSLAICFVDAIAGKTGQCCEGDNEAAAAGFCNVEETRLPIELADFSAVVDNGSVILNWTTASETNNAGFAIEHSSAENQPFEEIDFIDGAGTSLQPNSYTYTAKGLDFGKHRFRLKQVDFDGSTEYSSIVDATIELAGTHRLGAAYPNPFNPSTKFELVVGRDQRVKIDIINALGQRVQRLFDGQVEANKPTNFTFQAGTLPTGLYFYRVVGENFAQTRQMLLVK